MVNLTGILLFNPLLALLRFFFIIVGLVVSEEKITPDIDFAIFINFWPKIASSALPGFQPL